MVDIREGALSERAYTRSVWTVRVGRPVYDEKSHQTQWSGQGHVVDPRVQEILSVMTIRSDSCEQFGRHESSDREWRQFPTSAVIFCSISDDFATAVQASSSNRLGTPDFNEAFSIEFNPVRPMIAQKWRSLYKQVGKKNNRCEPTFEKEA